MNAKLSASQMRALYRRIHETSLIRGDSALEAVISPGHVIESRFADYAHRLGAGSLMSVIPFAGKEVLDVGCGRGRWSKIFAAKNANVTGVDISFDAIEALHREMPAHQFICSDLTQLPFHAASFDVINSVTVIQHLPYAEQNGAIAEIVRVLRPGGYFCMLENTTDFDARHVFPRKPDEWISAVVLQGLSLRLRNGSNYEVLGRLLMRWRQKSLRHSTSSSAMDSAKPMHPLGLAVYATAAIASYPVEWLCHRVPFFNPSHVAALFQKS